MASTKNMREHFQARVDIDATCATTYTTDVRHHVHRMNEGRRRTAKHMTYSGLGIAITALKEWKLLTPARCRKAHTLVLDGQGNSKELASKRRRLMSNYVFFFLLYAHVCQRQNCLASSSTSKLCTESLESCRDGTRVGSTLWCQHRPSHKMQMPRRSPNKQFLDERNVGELVRESGERDHPSLLKATRTRI